MAKGVMKKAAERRKKMKVPQSIALEGINQADFEEKVAEMKSEIKKGTRKVPGYSGTPGVVYVGCMPRGFHEIQMKRFFSQFGNILKLRVSRSKKTGNPKGYAFVMFEYDEVARVVADTMNNYLMFQKLMKCRHMPAEEVHPSLFKGCNRKFSAPRAHLTSMARHDAPKTEDQVKAIGRRARRKVQRKVEKLAALGIDYSINVGDRTITAKSRPNTAGEDEGPEPQLSTPVKQVLLEDSSDDEVELKTPPGSVRVKKAESKVNASEGASKTKAKKLSNTKNAVKSLKTKGRLGALGSRRSSRLVKKQNG